ncbi:MAG: hypothetical protein ACR2RE_20185 [Geminicoccaceae bacterium]
MILLKSLVSDQNGTSAIQYAFVAGILGLAVLAGSLALRGSIIDLYDGMADQANGALEVDVKAPPYAD